MAPSPPVGKDLGRVALPGRTCHGKFRRSALVAGAAAGTERSNDPTSRPRRLKVWSSAAVRTSCNGESPGPLILLRGPAAVER
ncbi:hypothetical protein NDU88_010781 [Pleurodeles waltl]|uniref:Uncharacterized protein n=1 Tax=Pleurodeles waltl TaxID=8319 RepID=A0AAV7PYW0_PLEWA|nr:hypothetical protein NDU88_010781 [Pleurodeles waltl]